MEKLRLPLFEVAHIPLLFLPKAYFHRSLGRCTCSWAYQFWASRRCQDRRFGIAQTQRSCAKFRVV